MSNWGNRGRFDSFGTKESEERKRKREEDLEIPYCSNGKESNLGIFEKKEENYEKYCKKW